MALFTMKDKRVYAVFLRTRRDGRSVLVREPYNVVEFGRSDTTPDASLPTFIEGLDMPALRLAADSPTDVRSPEVYDDIRVYDSPPFNARIGFGM